MGLVGHVGASNMTDAVIGKVGVIVGIAATLLIRLPYQVRTLHLTVTRHRRSAREWCLLVLLSMGMVFVPWEAMRRDSSLAFANYQPWSGQVWLGWALLLPAMWLFWRAHADLGTNWSPTLEIRHSHTLVTHGVYRWVRHPLYAAIWLWGLAQLALLPNWIAGPALLVGFTPMYLTRVPREEALLCEQFGEAYRTYMNRTGRIIPKIHSQQKDNPEPPGASGGSGSTGTSGAGSG
jgi:protein-S-isoprenylcysteine O-methyltransferase Ste14